MRIRKHLFLVVAILAAFFVILYLPWGYIETPIPEKQHIATSTTASTISTKKISLVRPYPALHTILPFKMTMTTVFWVGEPSDADNDYISNIASYWDEHWMSHYGGLDDPRCRTSYRPCTFIPKENPFYVALPYGEYDDRGLKASAKKVPWFGRDALPLLKNRWVAVRYGGKTCYGQWEDVGPNNEDDFAYVFGPAFPSNTFGERAGLDISPALWNCLGLLDNATTSWAFVEPTEVPDGPWKDIVTISGTSWDN